MTTLALPRSRGALLVDLAIAASAASAVCLLVLHLVRPGLDPGWSVVSQYALGAHGWILTTMFLLLAAACVSLAAALPSGALRRAGRTGRVLLVVAALGLTVSAAFVVGTPLHDVGSLLGNAGLAIGAVLVGRDLRRGLDAPARRRSAIAAHAPWICAVLMGVLIATATWGVGLLNRAVVLAYIVWLLLAARQSAAVRRAASAR